MPKAIYNNKNNDFYQSLKADVEHYFTSNNIKKTADWRIHLKTAIIFTTALAAYWAIMFGGFSNGIQLLLVVFLAVNHAVIGFNIMHDANHDAYSDKKWVNEGLGLTLNFLGANAYYWKQKHNILHHTYTNVDGLDDDIAKSPMIRQCETQKWVPAHKIQHIYLIGIYSVASLFWICFMDFQKYFTRRVHNSALWEMKPINHVVFWITKFWYFGSTMFLPIYLFGIGKWVAGFFIFQAILGITLAVVFQLAHVVENTHFQQVDIDETKRFDISWAEHEVRSCSNFAMGSKTINWLVGGLNFQTEHHLFPKICHIHYPAMSKIVRAKCAEFGLPYNSYPTMWSALCSHWRFMKWLGQNPPKEASLTTTASAA